MDESSYRRGDYCTAAIRKTGPGKEGRRRGGEMKEREKRGPCAVLVRINGRTAALFLREREIRAAEPCPKKDR